jgi:hypothetical protein
MLQWILDNWPKFLGILTALLGQQAAIALLLTGGIALALIGAGHLFPAAHAEIGYAVFISFFFGLIILAYGVFTTQEVYGLEAGKGFSVGLLAGVSAVLTGGAFYYAPNIPDCPNPDSYVKLLRLLAASVPVAGILGALFGLMRPTSQKCDPTPQRPPAPEFLSFIVGTLILIVVCILFIFIFNNLRALIEDGPGPQGLIRFWHVSLIAISFSIAYTGLITYLYGRPEAQQTMSFRFEKTISSVLAALFCAIVLFGPVTWFLRQADFEQRDASVAQVVGSICPKDPTQLNALSDIIIRVVLLILLLSSTHLAATYRQSTLLRVLDKSIWDKDQPEDKSG